jgi:hypothetical protein
MWLRSLEQTWKYDAEEKEKLHRFEKGLHPGGQAEEWWEDLTTEKVTWVLLMKAFEKKWPKPKPKRGVQETVIAELRLHCLDQSSLGQYVADEDGITVLSHVAWAQKAHRLLQGEADQRQALRPHGQQGRSKYVAVQFTVLFQSIRYGP